jgi:autotransporter-associated beta strand protein
MTFAGWSRKLTRLVFQARQPRCSSANRSSVFPSLRLEQLESRLVPTVHTWNGAGATNLWSDAGNWSGGTPAGDPAAILIFPSAARPTNTNDLTDLTIESLTFSSSYTIDGNAIELRTNISVDTTGPGSVTFAPNILLAQAAIITVASSADLHLTGEIRGDFGFTANGAGRVELTGANSYSGTTEVYSGTLAVGNNKALGSSSLILDDQAMLQSANGDVTLGNGFTVNGAPALFGGNNLVFTGLGILSSGSMLRVETGGGTTTLSGRLDGQGGLTVDSDGTVVLSTANDYEGPTVVTNGTLRIASSGGLPTRSAVRVNSPGTLDFSRGGNSIGINSSLRGTGNVIMSGGDTVISGGYNVSGVTSVTGGRLIFDIYTNSAMGTLIMTDGEIIGDNNSLVVQYAALSAGRISGGTLVILNELDWSGGIMSGPRAETVIAPGATLRIQDVGVKSLDDRSLRNEGMTIWSGNGGIWFSDGSKFINTKGASFDFGADADTRFVFSGGATCTFSNDAGSTFSKSAGTGSTSFDDGVLFTSSGTVSVQSGTLSLAGGSTSTGFTVAAGATLNFASDTFTLESTATITGEGNVLFSGGTTYVLGRYDLAGTTAVTGGAVSFVDDVRFPTLSLSGGTLSCTGTITIVQAMDWTDGTMTGAGETVIAVGASLNLGGDDNGKLLDGRSLRNDGLVTWTGSGSLLLDHNAVFTNQMTLEAQGDASMTAISGDDTAFINEGTFRKAGGIGTTALKIPFSNGSAGLVDVQTGTVFIRDMFTNFAGGMLTGGSYYIRGTLKFIGADLRNNAAQIVLDGPDAKVLDDANNDALTNFATNTAVGSFTLRNGRDLTLGAGFRNLGNLTIGAGSTLAVTGDYAQGPAASLSFEFAGPPDSGQFGQLTISGMASLDGTLNTQLVNGFVPNIGDEFVVLTFGSESGSFATMNLGLGGGLRFDPLFESHALTLVTDGGALPPGAGGRPPSESSGLSPLQSPGPVSFWPTRFPALGPHGHVPGPAVDLHGSDLAAVSRPDVSDRLFTILASKLDALADERPLDSY